jgi:hypothetical protein
MQWIQRSVATLLVSGALSLGFAGPAAAQVQVADGLVNVQVRNITILQDVDIGVAASVVALICNVNVSNVTVLGTAVDRSGTPIEVCTVDRNVPIIIAQN